ncbi:methyl-accepting chemotaxis protein [Pseudoalteromonas sp. A25]|uniref:methyl-accepting chemotaxis protein n=1 Tax=Pseudoalteromonas sp. A25 TaxID=116092 RepID=UPI0012605413|nr:methyl-accepting chemotaxis protein [Pseudoalteromonas sp. A25]BBN80919.1 methyl-accepting chemotaxis protein [Pseudoalteromonas sp. A25]
MLKQFSIKQKIILGFSSLGALLLISSGMAYTALKQIHHANTEVKSVALPILKTANALQMQQSALSKLVSKAFSEREKENLQNLSLRFSEGQQSYQKKLSQLDDITANKPQFAALLTQIVTVSKEIEQQTKRLLSAKQTTFEARMAIKKNMQAFEQHRSLASDAMLNLELVKTDNARQLAEVAGTGIRIDDMMYTLSDNVKVINQLEAENWQAQQEDVRFLLGNIQDNFEFLKRQSEGLDVAVLLNEFNEQLRAMSQLLDGPGYLYQSVEQKLAAIEQAQVAYKEAEQATEKVQNVLLKLQQASDEQFNFYENIAEQKIQQAQQAALIMAVVFIVLAISIAISTSRAMLGPLAAVNKMLGYLAQGDFSREMQKRTDDEFGMLIDNINRVKDSLRVLLEDINTKVHELEQMSESTQQRSHLLAQNSQQQLKRIDSAAHLASEIASSAQQVSEESATTLSSIKQAQQQSLSVNQIANDNKQHMLSLNTKMANAVEVMDKLTQHSENIESILDTILSIAEQTNLLALNAAIEAARAGEQGRGFAVVADEVRTLAARTQSSTNEINTMIESLQQDTKLANSAIVDGQSGTQTCAQRSESLSEAIEQIEEVLLQVNELSERASGVANDQVSHCEKIESVMANAQQTAKENASEMQHMAQASESLSRFANSLTELVRRFKL